jgi:cytochrome b
MAATDKPVFWSLGTRVLHWVLALSMLLSFATHEGAGRAHEVLGYVALVSALLRVLLGFFGSGNWRFSSFVRGIQTTTIYVRQLFSKTEARHRGHNPLGAWMVIILLVVCIGGGVSGWLYTTDRFWGVAWVGNIHNVLGHAIIPLVMLHIAGAIFTSFRHKENLVAAMIHGKKRAVDDFAVDDLDIK